MMAFRADTVVRSRHCDATGIVKLSSYTEMALEVIERWFDEALDWPFEQMHGGENVATPVRSCTGEFFSASRPGDRLVWRLSVLSIGKSSIDLALAASCGGDQRARMQLALILSDIGVMRARSWPDTVLARAGDYQTKTGAEGAA